MDQDLDTQGESLQVQCCFRTTHAAEGPFPAPTQLRYSRCTATRTDPTGGAATAVGVFYITATEDIAGSTGSSADISANAGSDIGGVLNIQKIAAFVWRVELFTITGGAYVLDDLMGAGNAGSAINVTIRRVDPS